MTKSKTTSSTHPRMPVKTPHATLAAEASEWDAQRRTPAEFVDDPAAVPRAGESTAISLRLPNALLAILKKLAEREGIGYQVLLKRWLDDRVRLERERMRAHARHSSERTTAPEFPLMDRDGDANHYEPGDAARPSPY